MQEAGQRVGEVREGGDEDEGIKAGEPEVGTVFLETHIRLLHRCEISNVSIPTQTFNKESSQLDICARFVCKMKTSLLCSYTLPRGKSHL